MCFKNSKYVLISAKIIVIIILYTVNIPYAKVVYTREEKTQPNHAGESVALNVDISGVKKAALNYF